jgi:uncharacterized membrane protein
MRRLPHLDWLRGIAVVLMVMWHTLDAWTLPSDRAGVAFDIVRFAAGWAAPMFLFFAGISVPLAAEARRARGMSQAAAAMALQTRGWQILLLAHLFRFQSFLLNPNSRVDSIFKPDILNILGLGIVVTALLWRHVKSLADAAAWLLVPALVLLALSPWTSGWWWPTLLHPRLEAYIRPVGNFGVFSIFPTMGYVLVGGFVGVVVQQARERPFRACRGFSLVGACLIAIGATGALRDESIAIFAWRTGAMLLAFAAAWFVFDRWPPREGERTTLGSAATSRLILLGQTSLFVYWVHVELAYGVISYPFRRSLTLFQAVLAYAIFMAVLTMLAAAWQRRTRHAWIPSHMTVREPGQPA